MLDGESLVRSRCIETRIFVRYAFANSGLALGSRFDHRSFGVRSCMVVIRDRIPCFDADRR